MISFDSNISDELFAAYIDGNTTSLENSLIEKAILQDDDLFLAKGIVSSAINSYESEEGFYQNEDYSSVANINNNAQDFIKVMDSDENGIVDALDEEDDDSFHHSENVDEDDFYENNDEGENL